MMSYRVDKTISFRKEFHKLNHESSVILDRT